MSKKKHVPQAPLVSSVSARIRQTVPDNGVVVTTPEETVNRKKNFLAMLDKATEQFTKALEKGKVELNSTLDLERIVKLTLLVSGEADSIQGSSKTTETETSVESAKIAMSKIEKILDSDDPTVNEIFNKLYEGYNKMNDESSGN